MSKLEYYAKLATNGIGYVAAQIEVTSRCFQQCPMCESWKEHLSDKSIGAFELELMQELHEEFKNMQVFEHLSLTGGDPQAWPALDEFIRYWLEDGKPYQLQITTALMQAPSELLKEVSSIRLSLDAADPATYKNCRGVARPDPLVALEWLYQSGIEEFSVLTTLSEFNFPDEDMVEDDGCPTVLAELLHFLMDFEKRYGKVEHRPLRKWMVLCELGNESVEVNARMRKGYAAFSKRIANLPEKPGFEISTTNDNICNLREYIAEAKDVRCWAGVLGCHIKCNGDVYPCCLVGGEAVETQEQFCIGNLRDSTLAGLQSEYAANPIKGYAGTICPKICQYKQFTLNTIAEQASSVRLALP